MSTQLQQNKFNFFIPLNIEKGGEDGKLVKISGVASTDAKDSDGETLIPAGFDFQPLLQSGFLNWNHQARTTSKAICGEPTAAKIINDGKDFYIEGVLYPNEEGKNVVELAETLQKHSPNRRLGFSIEGQAIERDILNPKRVVRARITGVAITQSPKNPNTLMNIIKGEYQDEFIEDNERSAIIQQFNSIVSVMFNTQISLEHCHRKTKNEPIHEALKQAYEGFADLKDNIIEQLTGLIGQQYDRITLSSLEGYNPSMNEVVANQLCIVGKQIEQFAQENKFSSIENLAQEVHGLGAKLKYKLSLKEGQSEQPLDKAMMVDTNLNPPSVEGTDEGKKLFSTLKKSEIYNQIYKRYTTNFEKAEQIYEFINQVKERIMITENITPEVLEKAMNLLDESIALSKSEEQKSLDDYDQKDKVANQDDEDADNKDIKKGDKEGDDNKNDNSDDDEDDEDFEKAMHCESIAKSLLDKGMGEEEVVKAMTSVGISLTLAETSCANCIAQANEEKDGGKITTLSKGEEEDLANPSVVKKIDEKFQAIGTIVKSQVEQIGELKKSNETLLKSNQDILSALKKTQEAPEPRRAVTNIKAIERFEKSEDGQKVQVFDANNPADMRALSNRLFQEVEIIKSTGGEDRGLEKAVADLEIAKSTNFAAISPRLRALNIEVRH